MKSVRRVLVLAVAAAGGVMSMSDSAGATIHPIVESFDCANEQAFAHHPLGDVADPPGQTPGATPGNGNNALRALSVVPEDSPARFGHKLDGQCGAGATVPTG
jgi:hypothetical protein